MNDLDFARGLLSKILSMYSQQSVRFLDNPEDFEAIVSYAMPRLSVMSREEVFLRVDAIKILKRYLAREVHFYADAINVCIAYDSAFNKLRSKYGLFTCVNHEINREASKIEKLVSPLKWRVDLAIDDSEASGLIENKAVL